jgi:alkylation response protein AidB-like acyl-CoA dehydrogenase
VNLATQTTGYFTTELHERLRQEVRDFAEAKVAPAVAEMEESRAVHVELSRLIAQQGWLGVTVDPRYGGMGMGHLAKTSAMSSRNSGGSRRSALAGACRRLP